MKKRFLLAILIFMASISLAQADIATFEDLGLAPGTYWNGSDQSTMFISGDAVFMNAYNSSYNSWDGWAYSSMTDTTTPGMGNQYAAITGSGAKGSATYGVAYDMGSYGGASPPNLSFGAVTANDYNTVISGAYFTNTTFAYLSMQDGDAFSKKFGGVTGDDPDYFKLIIKGITEAGEYTQAIDFYLADFRFSDNAQDYIVDDWTWVNLSGLGKIIGLEFSFESTDVGPFGVNTPLYVAMDDLNGPAPVPVPGSFSILAAGLLALASARRK